MQSKVDVKLVESHHEMESCMALRTKVFVEEQGVPPEIEIDEYDSVAIHVVATLDGHVVGTGRMFTDPDGLTHIGRMAVDGVFRRKGIGSKLLSLLEEHARINGIGEVILHAQTYVSSFYEKNGYAPQGGVFKEAGIEHIMMTKRLA